MNAEARRRPQYTVVTIGQSCNPILSFNIVSLRSLRISLLLILLLCAGTMQGLVFRVIGLRQDSGFPSTESPEPNWENSHTWIPRD